MQTTKLRNVLNGTHQVIIKEDLVTFNPRATKHVHLVFHNIAIVNIKDNLLEGDYKDRRMVYMQNTKEVMDNKK